MKKKAVTLETIAQTLENMQENIVHIHSKLGDVDVRLVHVEARLENVDARLVHIDARLENVDARLENVDARLENIETNLSDTQENVHYLVRDALMRDELQPILNREIAKSESRMISHMEGFIRRHITMEEEVLSHGHKIGVIERVLGLPNAV